MDGKRYKNAEGYNDPTAGEAVENVMLEGSSRKNVLIYTMRTMAELAGFEVIGRITLKDKETGKKYL